MAVFHLAVSQSLFTDPQFSLWRSSSARMEIKIPGDLSTASERGWRWRKLSALRKMKWKTPVERMCITMLICIFHWFATSARNGYRRRGEGRGGVGGGCSSNGRLVHCLDLTSHNNLFSTQTFQKSVSILCSYCSLLSGEFKAYTLLLQN